jgi:hypothetical protein
MVILPFVGVIIGAIFGVLIAKYILVPIFEKLDL